MNNVQTRCNVRCRNGGGQTSCVAIATPSCNNPASFRSSGVCFNLGLFSPPLIGMDDLYMALSHFRRRNFEQCIEYCTKLLLKNSLDQAAWVLKMNALKEQVYVDDLEDEEEGMAEMLLDENAIAQIARPGTSLKVPGTSSGGTSQAIRPRTQSGRPVSGVVRPGTLSGRTLEQAMKAPRTAYSSRPITSSSGRFLRLGTASMLSTPDGPFIDVAHLNISKL